ncbi:MAG: pseudouridine synthase [Bdellovibrionales bacterium]
MPLSIIYQDEYCVVVDKPAGYVVHKTPGAEDFPVLLQTLRDQLGKYVYPIHRLDRPTSGCILFSLIEERISDFQCAIGSLDSVKKYVALCVGALDAPLRIDRELKSDGPSGKSQAAISLIESSQRVGEYSLLGIRILTGRKHQIRRHLSGMANHIVGDVQNGKGWLNRRMRDDFDFHRMFLHCTELSFYHPILKSVLRVNSDIPDELLELINKVDAGTGV